MRLRASIVTYHTDSQELATALAMLKAAGADAIDVVDNGSEPRIAQLCEADGVNYTAHANDGYGAAHNTSLRRSIDQGATYHLVANSDIEFAPADLQRMLDYMDSHPDVGLLHPRVVGTDGLDQYTVRMLPTPVDLLLRRFIPRWVMPARRDRYLLKHIDHGREIDVAYVQGSFMLLRVDVLRRTGLFDERFFMYPEDIDLSRRIAQSCRVVYYPYAIVTHAHRAASYHSWRMTRIHIANMVRYFNKWGWWRDKQRREVNRRLKQQK